MPGRINAQGADISRTPSRSRGHHLACMTHPGSTFAVSRRMFERRRESVTTDLVTAVRRCCRGPSVSVADPGAHTPVDSGHSAIVTNERALVITAHAPTTRIDANWVRTPRTLRGSGTDLTAAANAPGAGRTSRNYPRRIDQRRSIRGMTGSVPKEVIRVVNGIDVAISIDCNMGDISVEYVVNLHIPGVDGEQVFTVDRSVNHPI